MNEAALQTLAKMAHVRSLFESATGGVATLDGTPGRGSFSFGNNPSAGIAGFYGSKGSGEVFGSMFNVFIELYANTIGLDLVPTVPQDKSNGSIHIVEPIYANGRLESASDKPAMVHVKVTSNGTPTALVVGTDYTLKTANSGGENIATVTYMGRHRLNGNYVFKIGAQNDNSGGGGTNWQEALVKDLFDSASNSSGIYFTADNYWSFTASTVDYVPGFTNFVGGFSGAGLNDTDDWFVGRQNGTRGNSPMSRQTGERSYYRSMALRQWHKNFSAETVHVDIEYTTEQIQDMNMDLDLDALELGETVIMDQIMQHMNDHILSRIFALGWQHHYNINQATGYNLNLVYDSASNTGASKSYLGQANSLLTIGGAPGVLPSSGAISENLSTLQRRLISRISYSSNLINNRSRRGRGDHCVLNTKLASAIQDVRGFTPASFDNDIEYNGLNYIGSFNGIRVYEDPMMDLSDNRVAVFRKGTEKDPGIKMCPYILAEKIETIAEGTMAPKVAMKSRYSLVEAGSNPETNYITFVVDEADGYGLV